MKFDKDKLARSVNGDNELELSLCGLHFGNMDMEIADGVKFELLLGRLVTLHIRKARDAMALQTAMQGRARQAFDGGLQCSKPVR